MTLRVLHVLNHSSPLYNGYTFRTMSILREQRRLGWDTHHLTSPKHNVGEGLEETVDGWHFHRTRWTPTGPSAALNQWLLKNATERRLFDVARRIKPDLLHAHSPVLNALPALRVARALKIPVVYEVRAFWEDAAVDQGTTTEGSLRYRLTRAMETYALKRVDHAFTICEGLRSDIVARGVPSDRVTVIPNAVDVDNFSPGGVADEELKSQLGLSGRSVVGFIGSFYGYEGLDLLIDSLPAMLARRQDVRLLLVGAGEQDENLRAQVARMGLQDKVVFTGRVPHSDVQRYYDLTDILVYPRHAMRLTELVTPLKPLEAMAQGRLLVASDVGGHRELIRHGETGQLFKAGDAGALATTVCDLLDQRQRWPSIRAAGRQFVEQERNWKASVSHYQPVFERLVRAAARA